MGVFPGEDPVYEGAAGDPWPGGGLFWGAYFVAFFAFFGGSFLWRGPCLRGGRWRPLAVRGSFFATMMNLLGSVPCPFDDGPVAI
jgi:hypothetical protein